MCKNRTAPIMQGQPLVAVNRLQCRAEGSFTLSGARLREIV